MTNPMRNERRKPAPATGMYWARPMRLGVAGVVVAVPTVAARLAYARRTSEQVRSRAASTITTDDGVQLHVETDGQLEGALTVVFVHAQIMQDSWIRTALAIATAFYPALVSVGGHRHPGSFVLGETFPGCRRNRDILPLQFSHHEGARSA